MNMKKEPNKARANSDGWLAGGGALSALAAFIGASCCTLPLILVNLGLGSALFASNLAFFARARPWFLGAAAVLIAVAALAAFRRGRRPSPVVAALLVSATLFTIGAYWFPYIEPQVLRWMSLR
jgi:mercuric ion transport protein